MAGINLDILNEQLRRLQTHQRGGVPVSDGEYKARLVGLKQATSRSGHPLRIAVFEVTSGPHAGVKIDTPVWGHAERLVAAPASAGRLYALRVYTHRDPAGRQYGRVNVEAIRACELPSGGATTALPGDGNAEIPSRDVIAVAASEYLCSFMCVGSIGAPREIVDWRLCFEEMARRDIGTSDDIGVYLSTFNFTTEIAEHQAKNDRELQARGEPKKGSLAQFDGPCFAHLLTFDTDCRDADGSPDPAGCQSAAISLTTALIEAGVTPDAISVFYSGSKGFHVQIPSMCAATVPSKDYHLVAKEFCKLVADREAVVIDEALYKKLQPLRAPNSRHEKTGLYKVRFSLDELIELPFEALRELAKQPRPFEPPSCVCEPVPELVALWRQAEGALRVAPTPADRSADGDAPAGISRATWDYLINGAVPGTRAESHFKAAANLADFGSLDELVLALLRRPEVISGLPKREAEAHVESALRRAAAGSGMNSGPEV